MSNEAIQAIATHFHELGYTVQQVDISNFITNDLRITYPDADRAAILLFQEDATLGVLFSDGKGSGRIDLNDPNSIQQIETMLYKGLQC